jgi:hypothetical protein
MHIRLKSPRDLLIEVKPKAKYYTCASEAIDDITVEERPDGVQVTLIPHDRWPTFPWQEASAGKGWLVAGRYIGGDEEQLALVSGTDYFLFRVKDIGVMGHAPEAVIPPQLKGCSSC